MPWRRPRHELLLLALVAVAALLPVYGVNAQDQSRLCLTRALVHGHLANDRCLANSFDKSRYGGHLYSDKAPGMSILEIPSAEALLVQPVQNGPEFSLRLWGVRILSSGLAFLLCAFLIGRVSEGLAPGFGAVSLVAFALGTLIAPFAAANFGHVATAALAFGAFVLAWRRRSLLAGVLAGTAFLFEYQAALILVIVGAYVALRGRRPLRDYVLGALPGVALLAVYNGLAFGAPWHLSYNYVDNVFAGAQSNGIFGIGAPHLFGSYMVFAGNGGLLVVSPVLVAAAWGLVLLAREHRAEAIACAAVTLVFLIVNSGYFLPYGGVSPGPRFLIPSLPFLALGLGPAFAWRPRVTAVLAAFSVVPITGLTLVWATNNPLHQTVWGELARVPTELGASKFVHSLTPTALHWIGLGRVWGAVPVALCAGAALAVALRAIPWRSLERRPITARTIAVVVASLYLVAAADTCAVFAYPYGNRTTGAADIVALITSISASSATVRPGDEVNFTVTVANPTTANTSGIVLTIKLAPGMQLLGAPYYERGSGCTGTSTLVCNLDFLEGGTLTLVRLGVRITELTPGEQTLTASVSSQGVAAYRHASFTVRVGP